MKGLKTLVLDRFSLGLQVLCGLRDAR
jgi:hypothetical protein